MDYCVPLGIPHSVFLGRPIGRGDAQWLDTDRGYALAWRDNQQATCRCGTRQDEWADDPDAYISDHYTCEGCARLQEEAEHNLDPGANDKPKPGQHTYLMPRALHELREQVMTEPPPDVD